MPLKPLLLGTSSVVVPSFFNATIVTLLVGDQKSPCRVHLEHLAVKSAFFATAFKPDTFVHAQSHELILPEDDVETVNRFITWAYTDGVADFSDDEHDRNVAMVKLYVLADKWQADDLVERLFHVIYKAWEASTSLPRADVIELVFEGLPDGNILRHLAVHARTWHWAEPSLEKVAQMMEVYPLEFLNEVVLLLYLLRQEPLQVDSPIAMGSERYWKRYGAGDIAIHDDVAYLREMTLRRSSWSNADRLVKYKVVLPGQEGQ